MRDGNSNIIAKRNDSMYTNNLNYVRYANVRDPHKTKKMNTQSHTK